MSSTCKGCKYLYLDGQGYSDYTWMDTFVACALDKNPHLPKEEPMDFGEDVVATLRWMAMYSQPCDHYSPGERVTVTPDGNVDFTDDDEQMRAIITHRGEHEPDYVTDKYLADCRARGTVWTY